VPLRDPIFYWFFCWKVLGGRILSWKKLLDLYNHRKFISNTENWSLRKKFTERLDCMELMFMEIDTTSSACALWFPKYEIFCWINARIDFESSDLFGPCKNSKKVCKETWEMAKAKVPSHIVEVEKVSFQRTFMLFYIMFDKTSGEHVTPQGIQSVQ
jgi:hypothetical protein